MSNTVTGKVTKVTKGKGQAVTPMGTYDRINMTITSDKGSLVIGKLVKPGNDGQKLVGQNVQCTYNSKEVDLPDGSTFTAHSTDSKGFILLDAVQGRGYQSKGTSSPGSSYNPDGARTGMLGNSGLALAVARAKLQNLKDVPEKLIQESVDIMKRQIERLEAPSVKSAPNPDPKPQKVPVLKAPTTDDADPFEE